MATKKTESTMKTVGVKNAAVITDGCNPELVKGADFDGIFEIPIIKAPDIIAIPKAIVPFSKHIEAILKDGIKVFFRPYPKTEGSPVVEVQLIIGDLIQKIHFLQR